MLKLRQSFSTFVRLKGHLKVTLEQEEQKSHDGFEVDWSVFVLPDERLFCFFGLLWSFVSTFHILKHQAFV